MDTLIEILIELIGALIEIFFGEVPLKKLPRPLRVIALVVFWFGLSALFVWLSYLAFSDMRALAIILFVLAVAFAAVGAWSVYKANEKPIDENKTENKENRE